MLQSNCKKTGENEDFSNSYYMQRLKKGTKKRDEKKGRKKWDKKQNRKYNTKEDFFLIKQKNETKL